MLKVSVLCRIDIDKTAKANFLWSTYEKSLAIDSIENNGIVLLVGNDQTKYNLPLSPSEVFVLKVFFI